MSPYWPICGAVLDKHILYIKYIYFFFLLFFLSNVLKLPIFPFFLDNIVEGEKEVREGRDRE